MKMTPKEKDDLTYLCLFILALLTSATGLILGWKKACEPVQVLTELPKPNIVNRSMLEDSPGGYSGKAYGDGK